MTLKEKLEDQIAFAKNRMTEATDTGLRREADTWNGYIQGLRFGQGLVGGVVEPSSSADLTNNDLPSLDTYLEIVQQHKCICSPNDLMPPYGECQCG